jgi:hypothetical protein
MKTAQYSSPFKGQSRYMFSINPLIICQKFQSTVKNSHAYYASQETGLVEQGV